LGGNGTVNVGGTLELASSGSLVGNNTFTGSGMLNWLSGGAYGPTTNTFASDFHVNFLGFDTKSIYGDGSGFWQSVIVNQGTMTWDSLGQLEGNSNGILVNEG